MNFDSRIQEAEKHLDTIKTDIAEKMGLAEAEERDLSEQESFELDALAEDVEETTKRIENLRKAEKALGMRAIKEKAPAVVKRVGSPKERPKGDLIFKMAVTSFLASQHKTNIQEAAERFYGHDGELQDVVKSAANPAATDVAGWAAELVDDALQGFLDILRGVSVGWELLGGAGISLNFDGLGAIKVPTREGTKTDLANGWVGERDAIRVQRGTTGLITINPYKWATISTFSKELAMRSTPQIESLIRQFIIEDTGTQLDNDLFGEDVAVSGLRPAGLMQGVTGTASAGATYANINTDILNLLNPLVAADCWGDPVIYLHPSNALKMRHAMASDGTRPFMAEMNSGTISGVPFRESTNIASDEHLVVDRAQIAAAVGAPQFSTSDTATIVEMDDDGVEPSMTGGVYPRTPRTGQVGDEARETTNPGPIRSLFQTETVAVKNVQYLSWHRMRSECVNRITGVAY